jgi:hypothetical protein
MLIDSVNLITIGVPEGRISNIEKNSAAVRYFDVFDRLRRDRDIH